VKRDHANLCSYNPKQHAGKASAGSVTGAKRPRSPESESSLKRDEDRWPRTTGMYPFLTPPMIDDHGICDITCPLGGGSELIFVRS
jgi:hypothetical protein